jgi:CDP-diacylglycerol--glycerol-3-phosphate 3-phosphatidyltransferase
MSLIPAPLRDGFERLLTPLIGRLVERRVSPNLITTIGTAVIVLSGVAFAVGWVRAGAALLLLSGVGDMLDGRVARTAGITSKFGAFYDSTLDRVGEAALFGGIALHFAAGGVRPGLMLWAVATAIAALGASLLVSYARARAEGLGLECKVGIAQRAERILGLGVPILFFGAGPGGLLLLIIVALLAVVAAVTVVQRIAHVARVTSAAAARTTQSRTYSDIAPYTVKGTRSDR